jgi:fatty acid desaturase
MTAVRTPKDVRAAYLLVKDLMHPDPARYWVELLLTAIVAWGLFLAVCLLPLWSPAMWLAAAGAVVFWYRASFMMHELTHQRRADLPGFHAAWNLLVGVPTLLPSIFYEGVHSLHHKKSTYGTSRDPEYLPMGGRPWVVAGFLAASFVQPLLLALRFFVAVPISWVQAKLRRRLFRYGSTYTIRPIFTRQTTLAEEREIVNWELVILTVWAPLLAATAAGWLPWRWLLTWYVVYSAVILVNRVRMACAHRFESDGMPHEHWAQFADSIDTPGGLLAEILAPLGSKYHALHHLFPSLPFHNAKAAYERLAAAAPSDIEYRASTSPSFRRSFANLVGKRPTPQ